MRIGHHSYAVEQLYSSQATRALQELLFKLALSVPEKNLEYKIDLQHRLTPKETSNRLALAAHRTIRLNAYWTHTRETSPQEPTYLSHKIRTGIHYPGVDLSGGLDLTQNSQVSFTGETFLSWGQDATTSEIRAQVELTKGVSANIDYLAKAKLAMPYVEVIEMDGTIMLDQDRVLISLDCQQAAKQYTAEVSLFSPAPNQRKLEAKLSINSLIYEALVHVRNDNVKSLHADVLHNKHYILNAVVRRC